MADNAYSYDVLEGAPSSSQPLGTWGDFAKTVGSSFLGTAEQLAAGAQYGFELGGARESADIADGFRKLFGDPKNAVEGSINPETRKLAAAAMTSDEFWEHPVLSGALKLTGMTGPMVAAGAGGLIGGTVAATVAAAATGGVLNASSGLADFYERIGAKSDQELARGLGSLHRSGVRLGGGVLRPACVSPCDP